MLNFLFFCNFMTNIRFKTNILAIKKFLWMNKINRYGKIFNK